MTAPDLTPVPLSPDRLTQIRTDLAAVPAPPWCWIGSRGAGGPELVTDHSGRQYLLRAVKPTDQHGEELLDPADDSPVYGDLAFRDRRGAEQYSTMRSGNRLAIGRTDYDPDSIVGVDNPVARWIERSPAHTQALLAEVDRLNALVESMCDALTGHDCPDPNDGPMATVTRAAVRLMEAERRIAELEASPPSRFASTPLQVEQHLTGVLAEDVHLRYQQAIGSYAVGEAAKSLRMDANLRQLEGNHEEAAEARELANLIDPLRGGGSYPSALVRFGCGAEVTS
jgi:hypothetical protein